MMDRWFLEDGCLPQCVSKDGVVLVDLNVTGVLFERGLNYDTHWCVRRGVQERLGGEVTVLWERRREVHFADEGMS